MAPNNPLPVHGNEKTMNLNHLILTNIQSSPYFKVNLYELKTYHEVIDEIYYKVSHLEPWEKGSRKTAGQTGMCGGVRGVGAGGIVSSAFCLLYKLFTLKLTRKQLMGLLTHKDSPYIRGLGFMYIRYTQPPADLWEWYGEYLDDEEEIDVRAGGGHIMTIGEMLRLWLTKLEWYSTLFPRIPVPIQKKIEAHLKEYDAERCNTEFGEAAMATALPPGGPTSMTGDGFGPPSRSGSVRDSPRRSPVHNDRGRSGRPSPPFDIAKEMDRESLQRKRSRSRSKDKDRHSRSKDYDRHSKRSRSKEKRHRSRSKEKRHRSRSRDRDRHRHRRSRSKDRRKRSRSRDRKHRSRSNSRDRHHKKHRSRSRERSYHKHRSSRESSFERDLQREKDRVRKDKYND